MSIGEIQFRSFVVERGHFGIVLFRGEVVLAEAEVDDLEFMGVMIDQNVERLDIPVHDAFGVDIV